jgi:hypothetical protein
MKKLIEFVITFVANCHFLLRDKQTYRDNAYYRVVGKLLGVLLLIY